MKHAHVILMALAALVFAGCGNRGPKRTPGQPRAVSATIAAQADEAASDATFALQIQDYARAAQSLKKSLGFRDDIPDRWEALAYAYKHLNQTSDARDAYRRALKLWKQYYSETKDPGDGMHELYVLIYLGRADEARALAKTLAKANPNNTDVQNFYQNKGVDAMLADPTVQDRSL